MNKFESVESNKPKSEPAPEKLHFAIEMLKEPIQDLLGKLHRRIDAGTYRLLIGGDASGRIPTLIFDKVIKRVYKEKGFDVPKTLSVFIAGGVKPAFPLEEKSEVIAQHLEEYIKENSTMEGENGQADQRVLIIEDTVSSGASIEPVTKALTDLGVLYDIATISFIGTDKGEVEDKLSARIFNATGRVPSIYDRPDLAGVKKNRGDLSATPHVSEASRKARVDIDVIADELSEWYLNNF